MCRVRRFIVFQYVNTSGFDSMFIFKQDRDTSAGNFVNEILLIVRIFWSFRFRVTELSRRVIRTCEYVGIKFYSPVRSFTSIFFSKKYSISFQYWRSIFYSARLRYGFECTNTTGFHISQRLINRALVLNNIFQFS